jgi:putative peptide zinc metalloprotease protein
MKLLLAALIAVPLTLQPSPAAAIGGPSNIVIVVNRTDAHLAIRANAQVTREPGMVAAPQNFAFATASCTDCQTIAVAIQLDFANPGARYDSPQNVAVASNEGCTRCTTIALAYQVFLQSDDPNGDASGVMDEMQSLDAELRDISTDPNITLADAEARITAAVARFWAFATAIDEQRSASE